MSTNCALGIILELGMPSGSFKSNRRTGQTHNIFNNDKHISVIEMELICGTQREHVVVIAM